MKFFALIPARAGSKRIINKNFKKIINKKSLLDFTVEQAINSKNINKIYISTDKNNIVFKNKLKKKKIIIIKRPKNISNSRTTMTQVVNHFIRKKQLSLSSRIVLLQPTSPFRKSLDIDKACDKVRLKNINCLVSVKKKLNFKHKDKWLLIKNKKLYLPKKKDFLTKNSKFFLQRNGPAILIIKVKKYYQKLYRNKMDYYVMSERKSLDINFPEDLILFKKYFNKSKKN